MDLLKFYVLTGENDQQADLEEQLVVFNRNHIVSIKPIRILVGHNVIEGFWIRLSNGKKYKATQVPDEIKKVFGENPHKRAIGLNFKDDAEFSEDSTDLH